MESAQTLTAEAFIEQLYSHQSDEELEKIQRYFKTGAGEYGEGDSFIGVRMGQVFAIAKTFTEMPADEIETLMDSPIHEARAGAMSIMDKCARRRGTPESRRQEMFDLYLRRIDRVNNWDLVDLAAPHVIGRYLFDKQREILYQFARSECLWERRTAIVATAYFIRQGDLDDTFQIAGILVNDDQELIQKAVGGWLREAGRKDSDRLRNFLDSNAAQMPGTMLRYASEQLDTDLKVHYRQMRKSIHQR